jgi:hypothetical protein
MTVTATRANASSPSGLGTFRRAMHEQRCCTLEARVSMSTFEGQPWALESASNVPCCKHMSVSRMPPRTSKRALLFKNHHTRKAGDSTTSPHAGRAAAAHAPCTWPGTIQALQARSSWQQHRTFRRHPQPSMSMNQNSLSHPLRAREDRPSMSKTRPSVNKQTRENRYAGE